MGCHDPHCATNAHIAFHVLHGVRKRLFGFQVDGGRERTQLLRDLGIAVPCGPCARACLDPARKHDSLGTPPRSQHLPHPSRLALGRALAWVCRRPPRACCLPRLFSTSSTTSQYLMGTGLRQSRSQARRSKETVPWRTMLRYPRPRRPDGTGDLSECKVCLPSGPLVAEHPFALREPRCQFPRPQRLQRLTMWHLRCVIGCRCHLSEQCRFNQASRGRPGAVAYAPPPRAERCRTSANQEWPKGSRRLQSIRLALMAWSVGACVCCVVP